MRGTTRREAASPSTSLDPEALLEKTLFTPVCGEPVALSMQLPLDGEGLLIDWVSRHTESGFAIELDEASPAPERLASYVAGVVPVRPEPDGSPDT